MNRTFDFYEYAGVIIPGVILTLGMLFLLPEYRALFSKEGITFGELGVFVLVAYAAGQLVQGIGNILEWAWWKPWGGRPSKQALVGRYLSAEQHKRLIEKLKSDPQMSCRLSAPDRSDYRAIVREVYAAVSNAGKATRVDIFNGNYGLLRGLVAAFVSLLLVALLLGKGVYVIAALLILLLLALQRMHRFAVHYATELFTQYLLLSSNSAKRR